MTLLTWLWIALIGLGAVLLAVPYFASRWLSARATRLRLRAIIQRDRERAK